MASPGAADRADAFRSNIAVERAGEPRIVAEKGRALVAARQRGFALGFTDNIFGEAFQTSGEGGPVGVSTDYAGRPVLLLWELDAKTMQHARK